MLVDPCSNAEAGQRRLACLYSPRPLTDGERWTAQALYDLRRRGYRPAAWRLFLADSSARSRDTRRARPALARQARRWGLAGAVAWLAGCRGAARYTRSGLPVRAGLLWWLAVWRPNARSLDSARVVRRGTTARLILLADSRPVVPCPLRTAGPGPAAPDARTSP